MHDDFLPYAKPTLGDAEVEALGSVLRSGWITSGPKVVEFERAFAAYVGADNAIAVSSFTAGFHLTLQALGIGPGDEVITPSLTWPAAVNMVHLAGARPVFADIDPRTLALDPAAVVEVATPATRAVVPVHFGGQPVDLARFREVCDGLGAVLIEDAAHAVGAEYGGKRIGSGKNPAVFSFHAVKNLATGEGGMVTTPSSDLASRLRRLRFHGIDHDAWQRHGSSTPGGYELDLPGWKYNLPDLQAALGLVQLGRLDGFIERRALLAACYDRLLDGVEAIERPALREFPMRHAWHLYPVLLAPRPGQPTRNEFRQRLRELHIGTGVHYQAVHLTRFYRHTYPVESGRLAHTESAAERVVSLPLFPAMTEDDVGRVVDAVKRVLER